MLLDMWDVTMYCMISGYTLGGLFLLSVVSEIYKRDTKRS